MIPNQVVLTKKSVAAGWLSKCAEEFGEDNCTDSVIWDTTQKAPIELGFVSS